MASANIEYWLERERQERRAYAHSSDPAVQEIHRQLADRYADAVWGAQEREFEASQPTRHTRRTAAKRDLEGEHYPSL